MDPWYFLDVNIDEMDMDNLTELPCGSWVLICENNSTFKKNKILKKIIYDNSKKLFEITTEDNLYIYELNIYQKICLFDT